jgi:peptidoglycan/LPS O-acetylase OafA/YrhL
LLVQFLTPYAFFAAFFFIGAWVSRFDLRWAPLGGAVPRWLGRISYPLYLCHVPIISFTGLPLILSIPLAFAMAAVLTETVEAWSIVVSRLRLAQTGGISVLVRSQIDHALRAFPRFSREVE